MSARRFRSPDQAIEIALAALTRRLALELREPTPVEAAQLADLRARLAERG